MADRVVPHPKLPAALLFILLASCAATRPIGDPVCLGEVAVINGPKVRPDLVIEDSRCPADVQCVSAGRLIIRATVFGGGWSKQLDLTLGVSVPVADGQLTLVKATPERTMAEAISSSATRFSFVYQGGLRAGQSTDCNSCAKSAYLGNARLDNPNEVLARK